MGLQLTKPRGVLCGFSGKDKGERQSNGRMLMDEVILTFADVNEKMSQEVPIAIVLLREEGM